MRFGTCPDCKEYKYLDEEECLCPSCIEDAEPDIMQLVEDASVSPEEMIDRLQK